MKFTRKTSISLLLDFLLVPFSHPTLPTFLSTLPSTIIIHLQTFEPYTASKGWYGACEGCFKNELYFYYWNFFPSNIIDYIFFTAIIILLINIFVAPVGFIGGVSIGGYWRMLNPLNESLHSSENQQQKQNNTKQHKSLFSPHQNTSMRLNFH